MSMDVDVISEIWTELKRYLNVVDRVDAAESLVNILIDHDVDADEIRSGFRGDADIKTALLNYLSGDSDSSDDDDIEPDDDDFDESDEEDWEN
jgi:hypothetical protein